MSRFEELSYVHANAQAEFQKRKMECHKLTVKFCDGLRKYLECGNGDVTVQSKGFPEDDNSGFYESGLIIKVAGRPFQIWPGVAVRKTGEAKIKVGKWNGVPEETSFPSSCSIADFNPLYDGIVADIKSVYASQLETLEKPWQQA